ncbi:DUF4376 domain-containing protein [Stenotrophomonas acidaminiphila]|uniref:DUF4376 domain-containing protein n=1 Tax=Stenotrophomonas acidaminiphila TaxID=128780 RepID=UPI0028A9F0C9|nr:DUF4376 domain-containing protein [Stenotrophomonas acidaminiphila]
MKTFYLWDQTGAPAGTVECEENGPLPVRCTPTEPPVADTGFRVVWRSGWVQEQLSAPDLAVVKEKLRAAATARRWSRETGGLTLGGVRVATALQDQNRIASVLAAMQVAQVDGVDFKAENGWVYLTAVELQGIAGAITAHVQACFSAERAHHEAIDALPDLSAALAYDVTEGWPA